MVLFPWLQVIMAFSNRSKGLSNLIKYKIVQRRNIVSPGTVKALIPASYLEICDFGETSF